MGMTPSVFFDDFVEKNFDDFEASENSVRYGFNAVLAASHMADHYFNYHKRHDTEKISGHRHIKDYFNYLCRQCPAFKDIRSIANAYKHLYTADSSSVDSTGAIESVKITRSGLAEIGADYESSAGFVVYKKRNGQKVRLYGSLKQALKMWERELAD